MTKTKNQKKSQHRVSLFRRPWMVGLIFLLLAVGVILVLIYFKPQPTEPEQNQPDSTEDSRVENQTNSATKPNDPTANNPENPEDKVIQYEGEDPNTLPELTGSIARKTISDGQLTVVASIDQYLSEPGICIVELQDSQGKMVYTASADAVPDVTTSICEPFIIPINQFSSGNYQIRIEINADGKKGIINEEVEL